MSRPLRLTSVMGVARALLATISTEDAVEILVSEFGWDATFQALSLLRGRAAEEAFGVCWTRQLTEPFVRELRLTPLSFGWGELATEPGAEGRADR